MIATEAEIRNSWMTWRQVVEILPFMAVEKYRLRANSWIRNNLIDVDESGGEAESPQRGKGRLYSLANCIELAAFWALTDIGYKPSALERIVAGTVRRAIELASKVSDPEEIALDEWPMVIFYESRGMEIGELRAVSAPAGLIAAWIENPGSAKAKPLAYEIGKLTGTHLGNILGSFIFQCDYIIRRTFEGYLGLRRGRE